MGGGLFELRPKAQEGIGRVFYCTLAGNTIGNTSFNCEKDAKDATKGK